MPLNYAAVVSHAYLHASELLQFVFPVDVMCWLSSPNIEKCSRFLSGPRIILDFIETRQIAWGVMAPEEKWCEGELSLPLITAHQSILCKMLLTSSFWPFIMSVSC